MKKREFLKLTGIVGAGMAMGPLVSCGTPPPPPPPADTDQPNTDTSKTASVFELPALGYAFNALAPAIDAQTMEIHHDRHHAGYVRKLNTALESAPAYNGMDLSQIMANVKAEDTAVRNNGGGHYNHSLYWEVMAPGGSNKPTGELQSAIAKAFGSMDQFSTDLFDAAKTRFGSGWAWLVIGADGKPFVMSTPNQDNPAMKNIAEKTGTPILGIDVWEHAYYLNYQNKRGDYIKAWMELINWDNVGQRYAAAMA